MYWIYNLTLHASMKTLEAQYKLIQNEMIKQSMICTMSAAGYMSKVDVLGATKVAKNIK